MRLPRTDCHAPAPAIGGGLVLMADRAVVESAKHPHHEAAIVPSPDRSIRCQRPCSLDEHWFHPTEITFVVPKKTREPTSAAPQSWQ
jgi:hypothetical protein